MMEDSNSLTVPQRGPGVHIPQSNTELQVVKSGLQVPMAGTGLQVPVIKGGAQVLPKPTGEGLMTPQSQFPAVNSQQRASGTQGGLKPRKKVGLKPGHSLMDWVRLGNQKGKVLNGVSGRSFDVSIEELAKHNKLDDAWISIRAKVYNVTPYMEYHPGGEEELMKGVGGDGTRLFNEVHQWVNFEGMLEKCYIGRLKKTINSIGGVNKKPQVSSSMLKPPMPSPLNLAPPQPIRVIKPKARYDWYQTNSEVTITIYAKCNTKTKDKVILDIDEKDFRVTVFLDDYVYTIHLELCDDVSDKCEVRVRLGPINRVFLVLQKKTQNHKWPSLGKPYENNNNIVLVKEKEPLFRTCKVVSITRITHDTKLYTFRLPTGTSMHIPTGYHVHLKLKCNGDEVNRPYTIVVPSLLTGAADEDAADMDESLIHLMIKIYTDGLLTQQLSQIKQGDSISISEYEGSFDESCLSTCSHLLMLAAGTGFTPMVKLLHWGLIRNKDSPCKLKLLFFNKTEKDILWRSDLATLVAENSQRFEVINILSAPGATWAGPKGRVRKDLVDQYVPSPKDIADQTPLVCICGPTPFTNEAFRLIKEHGFTTDAIHLFIA